MNSTAQAKLDYLNKVAEDIKHKFINLDVQIDKFKDAITPWYVAPELLTRPTVVGLWGMTGVGKTAMVREFISALHLSDIFKDVTCTSQAGYGNIRGVLSEFNANAQASKSTASYPDGYGALLLDEFQTVKTRGMMGSRSANSPADLWEILSSGKIRQECRKIDLIELIANVRKLIKAGKPEQFTYLNSVWGANFYSKLLKIKGKSTLEVMSMTPEEFLDLAERRLESFNGEIIYQDFSKLLVIIAGNMDVVFTDATNVAGTEVDADQVYDSSLKVNIFDIKRGLACNLFPEEVSRLGNTHIIFYGFRKTDFQKLIVDSLAEIADRTQRSSGITLKFDPSVYQMIYRNGVFPCQGVRPLVSTIQGLIEANIPKIVYGAAEADKQISVSYDTDRHVLVTSAHESIPCLGGVDEAVILLNKDQNEKRCTSVHESGHALVYAELFGAIPASMVSMVVDSKSAAGFITTHQIRHTSITMENFICTAVAGMCAEEVVFGKEFRTVGCSSDLLVATQLAAKFVRNFAFTDKVKAVVGSDPDKYNNMAGTSEFVNEMVIKCIAKTKDIIRANIELLKEISDVMFDKCRCTPEDFKEISDKHGKAYKLIEFNAKITPNFVERYELFKESGQRDISEVGNESACRSFFKDSYATRAAEPSIAQLRSEVDELTLALEGAGLESSWDLFEP